MTVANAQSLTPTLSQRAGVKTVQLTVVYLEKINNYSVASAGALLTAQEYSATNTSASNIAPKQM